MGGGMGSFVEGLAGGIQQGHKLGMAKQLQDAQMQHLKTTNKAAELSLKMEQYKGNIFESMTDAEKRIIAFPKADDSLESKLKTIMDFASKQGGGQSAPLPDYAPGSGTGPTAPGAMSLPEKISSMQSGGGGGIAGLGLSVQDLLRGVLKKELGAEAPMYRRTAPVIMPDGSPGTAPMNDMGLIDMSKAVPAPYKLDTQKGVGEGMAPTETPVNPYTRQPVGAPIQIGPPPTMQVETPTAGGGKVRGVVPLFPGGSKVSGTGPGGIRTELDLLDVPIPASDITKWSDGKGGNPPLGWTPRQAQGRGFKQTQEGMPSETGGKVVMLGQAVDDMEKAIGMILPPGGGFNRKLAIGAATNSPEFVIEGSQIVRSSVLNAMSAKLRMETGAQSNESEIQGIVDRYWPSGVRDNEKSARYKMTRLLQFMKDGKFIMDPKGRIVAVDPPGDKGKPPALGKKSAGAPKTWQDYKAAAGGQ